MATMITFKVEINEEHIKEIFEECEVKFSKAKLKALLSQVDYIELEMREQLEENLKEQLSEIIQEEWEK